MQHTTTQAAKFLLLIVNSKNFDEKKNAIKILLWQTQKIKLRFYSIISTMIEY